MDYRITGEEYPKSDLNNEIEFPLVSCITTTFNKFGYIFQTLDSIFSQTYPNIELVFSDDGSDNCPIDDIVNYIDCHKRDNIKNVVYNIHKENYGTVKNSNINRSLAHGKYYIGIGSDDYLHDKNVVKDIVEYFQESGAKIITCQRLLISEDGKSSFGIMPFKDEEKFFYKLSLIEQYRQMCSFGYISGSCTYMRADFFHEMGGLDEHYMYFEDYPLYLKLLRTGQPITFFKRISVCYRFGVGQSTASKRNNPFKMGIYKDRIRSIEKEIIPYYSYMEWWRKKHINAKILSFTMEIEGRCNNTIKKYIFMFCKNPIGTLVHVYYQLYYKCNTVRKVCLKRQ